METNFIQPSEHVFVAGSTGSGKSVLADVFTAGMPETVIKIDIKNDTFARRKNGEPVWRGLVEGRDFDIVERLDDVRKSEASKIIYVPGFEEADSDHYDELCKYVYDTGFTRLWIDELMLFCESAVRYPKYLKALLVSGRTRDATVFCCTQRPYGIPPVVTGNCQHFFVFRLTNDQDRQKLAAVTGCQKLLVPPERYAFWYYRDGEPPDGVRKWRLEI